MDLRSSYPFWLLKNGIVSSYPSLLKNSSTEVVIMGAGISGALAAWHLCKAGVKVTIADKRHVGMGSTAASTALLQYEIDTPLHKLAEMVGEANAVKCYKLCEQAIYDLGSIATNLKVDVGFEIKESFQYASFKSHVPALKKEFNLRKQHGMYVKWMQEEMIVEKFGFAAPAGILSKSGGQVDPYKLTHCLLQDAVSMGLKVYDHTEIMNIEHTRRGVKLTTVAGHTISANKLIIAAGYESQKYLSKKVEKFTTTYALASEPLTNKRHWYKNCLIWETSMPYLYMRTTSDNRIIVGGKDDDFSDPVKRAASLPRKVKELEKAFVKKFPDTPFKTDFKWAGVFAGTKDGLPYIGSVAERPNTFFALGFGGNGMTYSLLAAQIITDIIKGKENKNASLFSFDR